MISESPDFAFSNCTARRNPCLASAHPRRPKALALNNLIEETDEETLGLNWGSSYGWLSKLWSLFGSLLFTAPNFFDNHPYMNPKVLGEEGQGLFIRFPPFTIQPSSHAEASIYQYLILPTPERTNRSKSNENLKAPNPQNAQLISAPRS